jgi:UDP-N-acetylglucosamine--N-acetylmuramyl-(pentapeptide) pyrophosphoryl-undecaprenol N-acetylglucosamine transferase
VADILRAQGWEITWIGGRQGIEHTVVPAAGYTLRSLPMTGLRGKSFFARAKGLVNLLRSLAQAAILWRKLRPQVMLGMGGYASFPGAAIGLLAGTPLVIHEQNAVAGTANRWLARWAARVICGFDGAARQLPGAVVLGNPVRAAIVAVGCNRANQLAQSAEGNRPTLRLVILGGSLGSRPLNETVPEALCRLLREGYAGRLEILHQCGAQHGGATEALYGEWLGQSVRVVPFIDNMAAVYEWCDLAICRSGALTVSELAVAGVPSILVPLPHAIDDHQTHNARDLADRGAAQLVPQKDLTPAKIVALVEAYLAHPEHLQQMSRAALAAARPQAAQHISAVLEEVLHDH